MIFNKKGEYSRLSPFNPPSNRDILTGGKLEIRFASQGRKKRRRPQIYRRNGPLIAKNVFINDWSFSSTKSKRESCK